jgi:branched-chain amino acid transport system substrate-binding protein
MRTTVLTSGLAAIALLAVATGCASSPPMPVPSPSASVKAFAPGDGVLRIGTLMPNKNADLKAQARAEIAAVERAVTDANRLGGFNGVPIETFHKDSGALNTKEPEAAFDALVADGVDVVIGPADADLVSRLAPKAADAGVLLISPTAHITTAEQDANADFGAAVVTLGPSAAGQAEAIAASIGDAGGGAVAYLHDADDAGLGEALSDAILGTGNPRDRPWYPAVGTMADDVVLGADPAVAAKEAAASSPDVVVVSASDPVPVTEALMEAGVAPEAIWIAARDFGASTSYPSALAGVTAVERGAYADDGFRAIVRQSDPSVREYSFAPEAYDATAIAILAATVAHNDTGVAIAATLQDVANVGYPCTSIGACLAVIADGQDINYLGVSGAVDVTARGNVRVGSYTIARIDGHGVPVPLAALEKVG